MAGVDVSLGIELGVGEAVTVIVNVEVALSVGKAANSSEATGIGVGGWKNARRRITNPAASSIMSTALMPQLDQTRCAPTTMERVGVGASERTSRSEGIFTCGECSGVVGASNQRGMLRFRLVPLLTVC